MKRKAKSRIYAIFQITTFTAILLIVFGSMFFMVNANEKNQTIDYHFWAETGKSILTFETDEVGGVFSALFVYIGIALWILSWIVGWMMLKVSDRNLFDQMFLLFLMVPFIANIFALLGQLFVESAKYTTEKLTKDETNKEKKDIVRLFNKSLKEDNQQVKTLIEKTSNTHLNRAKKRATNARKKVASAAVKTRTKVKKVTTLKK